MFGPCTRARPRSRARPRRGDRLHQPVSPVPLPPPAEDLRPRLAVHHRRRRHAARHHPVRRHPHHPTTRFATTRPATRTTTRTRTAARTTGGRRRTALLDPERGTAAVPVPRFAAARAGGT